MKTAEETIDWLKSFYELLGSGSVNNREGISNAYYYIEKYLTQKSEIKDMIDVVLDKWKYEGDYISSNDFKKALTELRSKL